MRFRFCLLPFVHIFVIICIWREGRYREEKDVSRYQSCLQPADPPSSHRLQSPLRHLFQFVRCCPSILILFLSSTFMFFPFTGGYWRKEWRLSFLSSWNSSCRRRVRFWTLASPFLIRMNLLFCRFIWVVGHRTSLGLREWKLCLFNRTQRPIPERLGTPSSSSELLEISLSSSSFSPLWLLLLRLTNVLRTLELNCFRICLSKLSKRKRKVKATSINQPRWRTYHRWRQYQGFSTSTLPMPSSPTSFTRIAAEIM